jgi:hypothetical protein
MHNCRKVERELVDLVFDDIDMDGKRRLLTEIEGCANCSDEYHSLSDTLFVFERTAEAALPPESYWPPYNATLRARLHAPVPANNGQTPARPLFWRRWLAAKFQVPVPVAVALVVGLVISSALAFRRVPARQTTLAPSPPAAESVRLLEVPFVQEKIVTRNVYVEKKRSGERGLLRPLLPAVASAREMLKTTIAGNEGGEDAGFFTRANLKGFQPADDMKIRVLKRNNTNDK